MKELKVLRQGMKKHSIISFFPRFFATGARKSMSQPAKKNILNAVRAC